MMLLDKPSHMYFEVGHRRSSRGLDIIESHLIEWRAWQAGGFDPKGAHSFELLKCKARERVSYVVYMTGNERSTQDV